MPILGIIASSISGSKAKIPAAYVLGGQDSSFSRLNSINKITFAATPVRSVLSATLPSAVTDNCGLVNAGTSGYSAGGNTGSITANIVKLLFSSDTTSTLSATLGTGVRDAGGINNASTAGYVVGGYNDGTGAYSNNFQKLTYSNETTSTISATTTYSVFCRNGLSNGTTAGYSTAGRDSNYTYNTTWDKLTYSNETKSTLGAGSLSFGQTITNGISYSGTAGYWNSVAQQNVDVSQSIYKLNFSNDSQSTLSAQLTSNNCYASVQASNDVTNGYGFTMGGYKPSTGGFITTIQKLDFSNETNANISATLSVSLGWAAGVGSY